MHLKNVDMYTFRGEGGLRKYVLYTHLNVDNYGRFLSLDSIEWCCMSLDGKILDKQMHTIN